MAWTVAVGIVHAGPATLDAMPLPPAGIVLAQHLEQTMQRFEGASEPVQELARDIARGQTPAPDDVAKLAAGEINRSYGQVAPRQAPEYGFTLLREAVTARNLDAARVLIAAGADPFFNDNEIAYLAVQMKTVANPPVWWPDFSQGVAFLDLWLGAGGDPNAANALHGSTGNLLVSADPMNLEAMLRLLEAGTDPWHGAQVVLGGKPRDSQWPSFFALNANVTLTASEKLFRIAEAGLAKPGTADQHSAFLDEYELGIGNVLQGGSGPARDRAAWGVQKALAALLPALELEPTPMISALLEEDLSDVEVGFFLAPGQVRSAADDPTQLLSSDTQWGTQRWDE
ncbi:MAG: hypothetical protein AAF601_10215 [Pseudomonadota bacterium]